MSTARATMATLSFKDVSVTLNKKEILSEVSGVVKVGQMLAIMGPSGAGKSTLLNALAGRIDIKSGSITLNGRSVDRQLRRKISYVMQHDVFQPSLTLNEMLTFQTLLRLPDSMPLDERMARLMEIVEILGLEKCINTSKHTYVHHPVVESTLHPAGQKTAYLHKQAEIGSFGITGLSGGEKKRASIACELLTNPNCVILDEPTSGLDSSAANSLMTSLESYAKQSRKTVIATIHQPSGPTFQMFDHVLLLHMGRMAFFGARNRVEEFFAGLGMHRKPQYNLAEFILEQLKADDASARIIFSAARHLRYRADWPNELTDRDKTCAHHDASDNITIIVNDVCNDVIRCVANTTPSTTSATADSTSDDNCVSNYQSRDAARENVTVESYIDPQATWQTGFMTQYVVLTKRHFRCKKSSYFSALNFGPNIFLAVFTGLVWFQTARTEETASDRLGLLYAIAAHFSFVPGVSASTALSDYTGVYERERSAGLYRLSTYYLAVMTNELPATFLLPTFYVVLNYWMVNLMPGLINFVGHWLILVLSTFTAQSFGLLFGAIIPSPDLVITFTNTFLIVCLLTGGFYNMHVTSWLQWVRYSTYLTYTLNALSKMEFLYGDSFQCDPGNTRFPSQCFGNNTKIEGQLFLVEWDLHFTPLYVDILALFVPLIGCRLAAYFVMRFLRRPKSY